VIRASACKFSGGVDERRYDKRSTAATNAEERDPDGHRQTPRDADVLRKNPLGVYVHAISWSKELAQ